jgi:hypothetical protein
LIFKLMEKQVPHQIDEACFEALKNLGESY